MEPRLSVLIHRDDVAPNLQAQLDVRERAVTRHSFIRPDAVVVKGSQDWRRYASTAGVRHQMRQWLAGGGVLVEGDGEFTDLEQSALQVAQADAQTVRGATAVLPVTTTKLEDVRFGYSGLRATTF